MRGGERIAVFAMALMDERGEREGREGHPFSPPPMSTGLTALEVYRRAYHRGMDRRNEEADRLIDELGPEEGR